MRPAAGASYRGFPMRPAGGYEYAATFPAGVPHGGPARSGDHGASAEDSASPFPAALRQSPVAWNYDGRESWKLDVSAPARRCACSIPRRTPRSSPSPASATPAAAGSSASGCPDHRAAGLSSRAAGGHKRLEPSDYTASLVIASRIEARQETIAAAQAVRLRLRGLGPRQVLHVTLMEDDGTSWTAALPVDSTWSERSLPLAAFAIGRGVLLPQGFPGEWSYWVGPAEGRGGPGDRPRLDHLERLQLSLRREDGVVISRRAAMAWRWSG